MAHLALGPLFSPFIFIFLARQESAIRFAFPPTLPWTREIGLESSEVLWIGLDWIGLDWIGLDWIGLEWIGVDWSGWIGLAYMYLSPYALARGQALSRERRDTTAAVRVRGWRTSKTR